MKIVYKLMQTSWDLPVRYRSRSRLELLCQCLGLGLESLVRIPGTVTHINTIWCQRDSQKAHRYVRMRRLTYKARKLVSPFWLWPRWRCEKNRPENSQSCTLLYCGEATPEAIAMNFVLGRRFWTVINCTKFRFDWSWGFQSAGPWKLAFPIESLHRL